MFWEDSELILLLDPPAKPIMTKLDVHDHAWENAIPRHFIFFFFLPPKGEGGNKFSDLLTTSEEKKEGSTPISFPLHVTHSTPGKMSGFLFPLVLCS